MAENSPNDVVPPTEMLESVDDISPGEKNYKIKKYRKQILRLAGL